jgi:hypothetical protein
MKKTYAVYKTDAFGFSSRVSENVYIRWSDASRILNKMTADMPYFLKINYSVQFTGWAL